MRFAISILLLALACPIWAQAPEETQPEDTRAADESEWAIEFTDARVRDVLARVTEVTGVEHTSQGGAGDLCVTIHVRDADPEKIRACLKTLLRLHWRKRTKDGETSYILWQDARGRAEQEELLNKLSAEKAPQRYYDSLVGAYDSAAALDPEGLKRLKEEEPFAYLMATNPAVRAMRDLLVYLGPDAFNMVGPEGQYEIPYTQLTPAGQFAVRQYAAGMREFLASFTPQMPKTAPEIDWSRVKVQIRGAGEVELPDGMGTFRFGGMVQLNGPGVSGIEFPLIDPYSPWARAIGRTILRITSGELGPDEADHGMETELVAELDRERKATEKPAASERKIPEELKREVEIKSEEEAQPHSVDAFLAPLAEAAEIDIYIDTYPDGRFMDVSGLWGKRPLWKTLDLVAQRYGRTWEYENGAVVLRDKRWYEKRTWILPAEWFERWRKALGKREKLTIDEICRMAVEITDEQARYGLTADTKLSAAVSRQIGGRPWEYRLYGVLSSGQVMAAEGDGLPLAALGPEQAAVYANALGRKGVRPETLAGIWLRIEREDQQVQMRFSSPGREDEITVSLKTP